MVVQDEFRRHLEQKVGLPARSDIPRQAHGPPLALTSDLHSQIREYQTAFPDELGIVISHNHKQKDQLDLILLEFRKLREGIISSHRTDAFAVEVYETSAKLAMLADNGPQLATVLPHLVRNLHWPKPGPGNTLESQLEGLQLAKSVSSTDLDTRARFASYYLLHVLCRRRDLPAFQSLLAELVDFEVETCIARKPAAHQGIPHNHPHMIFVLSALRITLSNDYAKLARILAEPRKYDKFAWITLKSTVAERQAAAWNSLRAGYLSVPGEARSWLAAQLLLEGADGLQPFLEKERWTHNVETTGSVLLKRGTHR